jgi:tRNA (guanine37-N1)-methyltransferase
LNSERPCCLLNVVAIVSLHPTPTPLSMKHTHKAFLFTASMLPCACSFGRHGVIDIAGAQQRRCLAASASTNHFHTDDWRSHPDLNIRLDFDTWVVPSRHVQTVLQSKNLLPDETLDLRKKIRLVQPYNATHQLVLRKHDCNNDQNVAALLHSLQIQEGPTHSIQLDPSYFTSLHILQSVLPVSPPTSYEQVGHVAHLNVREQHLPYRHVIAEVFLETLPSIETVVMKVGQVEGPYRTYDLEVLAGRNDTQVTVVEDGLSIHFDLRKVYWCSRLAGERQYLLRQFKKGDTIVDVFSGVGGLCLLAAKKLNANVHANDWNPHAIESLREASQRYNLNIATTCGDSYEFLVDLGLSWDILPHHVVMNYPLEAPSFLSALRWWRVPKRKGAIIPTVHVYTFVRGPVETAIDLVAHNLLPEGNEPTPNRKQHLDELKCEVRAREIRDVAPGKVVVCVSFKATAQLLRHMQGDYV